MPLTATIIMIEIYIYSYYITVHPYYNVELYERRGDALSNVSIHVMYLFM